MAGNTPTRLGRDRDCGFSPVLRPVRASLPKGSSWCRAGDSKFHRLCDYRGIDRCNHRAVRSYRSGRGLAAGSRPNCRITGVRLGIPPSLDVRNRRLSHGDRPNLPYRSPDIRTALSDKSDSFIPILNIVSLKPDTQSRCSQSQRLPIRKCFYKTMT
ncbi:hypothetical protein MARINON1_60062 [Marinobacter salarius]|nr:hypothetical protein MARINON1_60062 [Marinobacter salarius]